MRIFVTGGTGVLGQALAPRLAVDGHEIVAPGHAELDLFDPVAVREALSGAHAAYHLATRIPDRERSKEPGAWDENDRIRTEATRTLVDASLSGDVDTVVFPSIILVYPPGPADEDTPVGELPPHLRSAVSAEIEVARFAASGRRGIVLRLGILWGPGTGSDRPADFGAPLHIHDAADALARSLDAPSGTYVVVADGFPVANQRFKAASGWSPAASPSA